MPQPRVLCAPSCATETFQFWAFPKPVSPRAIAPQRWALRLRLLAERVSVQEEEERTQADGFMLEVLGLVALPLTDGERERWRWM